MPATAKVGPDQNQEEPRSQSEIPVWVIGIQESEPPSAVYQGTH